MKKEYKILKSADDLEESIIFLAEDLKRRAKDISIDGHNSINKIEIKTTIMGGELLQWEITKTYNAYKEPKNEKSN